MRTEFMKNFKNMKTINHEEAARLMGRYFEGLTSNVEEEALRRYFAAGDSSVAPNLRRYGAMLEWLDDGAWAEPERPKRGTGRRRLWLTLASAAAALAIIGGLSFDYVAKRNAGLEMYAGSYVVKDGVRITDISKILPELERVEKNSREIAVKNRLPGAVARENLTPEILAALEEVYDY